MRRSMVASLATALMGIPFAGAAENFTNIHFLTLEKQQRDYWLEGAILMAGQVVNLQNPERAQCALNWYIDTPLETQALIFASMQRYPDWSPSATIVALMQRECGNPLIE